MESYKRYARLTEKKYNKKGLSWFMMRRKSDRFIIPYLKKIKGRKVLEVGVGYGYYKDYYFNSNEVTGYDINPEMGKKLGIKIISGKADEIKKVNEKYDRVLSFFMTEYLNYKELETFIRDSVHKILAEGGVFGTTIFLQRGLGRIYTNLAKLKGIRKYSYSYSEIKQITKGMNFKITPLNTYFNIPMAVFLEIKK